jgi:hypothetical protein
MSTTVAVILQTAIGTLPLIVAFEHERIGRAIKKAWRRLSDDE